MLKSSQYTSVNDAFASVLSGTMPTTDGLPGCLAAKSGIWLLPCFCGRPQKAVIINSGRTPAAARSPTSFDCWRMRLCEEC